MVYFKYHARTSPIPTRSEVLANPDGPFGGQRCTLTGAAGRRLDVDLSVESIGNPDTFPLVSADYKESPRMLNVHQTVPILRIFDLEKAREFYIGFLGFQVDWEHRFDAKAPAYLQVSRSNCVLHLTEHHGDCCPGSTVFLRVSALEQFHQEISSKGYAYMRPEIELAPWNAKLMQVTDPFGNRLRFNEYIS